MASGPADGSGVALRALEAEDGELIHAWFQDEWFWHIFGSRYPASRKSRTEWAADHGQPSYEHAIFMICVRDSAEPIGLETLRAVSPEDRSAELSFVLGAADDCGQGLDAQPAALLCRFGFDVMGLRWIYAWVVEHNFLTIAICEAFGAVREGVARQARLVGRPVDVRLYGLLAEEFARLHRGADRVPASHGVPGGMGGGS